MSLTESEMTVVVASVEAEVIVEVAVEAWEEIAEVLGVVMAPEEVPEEVSKNLVVLTEEVLLVLAAKAHLVTDLLEDHTAAVAVVAFNRFVWSIFDIRLLVEGRSSRIDNISGTVWCIICKNLKIIIFKFNIVSYENFYVVAI
jgi:hypothetical protein